MLIHSLAVVVHSPMDPLHGRPTARRRKDLHGRPGRSFFAGRRFFAGVSRVGLVGWVGLGWVGLGWVGLGWVGLGWFV